MTFNHLFIFWWDIPFPSTFYCLSFPSIGYSVIQAQHLISFVPIINSIELDLDDFHQFFCWDDAGFTTQLEKDGPQVFMRYYIIHTNVGNDALETFQFNFVRSTLLGSTNNVFLESRRKFSRVTKK